MPSYRQIVGDEYRVRMKVPKDLIGIYVNHQGRHVREVTQFCGITQAAFDANSGPIIAGFQRDFAETRRRHQQEQDTDPAMEAVRRAEAALDRLIASGDVGNLQDVIAALGENVGQFIAEARKAREERDHGQILGRFAGFKQDSNDFDAGARRLGDHGVVGTMSVGSQETYWDARTRIDAARAPAVVIPLDIAITDWKAQRGPWRSTEAEKKATRSKERAAKSLLEAAKTSNMAAIDASTMQAWMDGLTGRQRYDYVMDVKKLYRCVQGRFSRGVPNPAAGIETPQKSHRGSS